MAPRAARNQKTKYTAADIKVDARPTTFYVVLSAPYCFSNFCLAAFRQLEFIFPIALFISCSCALARERETSLLDFRRRLASSPRIKYFRYFHEDDKTFQMLAFIYFARSLARTHGSV